MPTVASLSVAPVKGLGLAHPDEILLGRGGVPGDRRFFLVDDDGKRLGAGTRAPLVAVRAHVDASGERLTLVFPDGSEVAGTVVLGAALTTPFSRGRVRGRVVEGPWAGALGSYLGRAVRLVRAEQAATTDPRRAVSLVSTASVEELRRRSGAEALDVRRFRMSVQVDGCRPHEEDDWVGRVVAIGDAVARVTNPLERCVMTKHDPETGRRDFDTLRAIAAYRGVRDGKAIDFGVFGEVVTPGRVHVGDAVVVSDA